MSAIQSASIIPEINLDKFSEETEQQSLNQPDVIYEKHKRPACEFKRQIICITILLVVCFSLTIVVFKNVIFKREANICLSDECIRSAAALKQSMNFNVDPCDDFYEYVCGNWAEDRSESDDGISWIQERQLKVYRNIWTQLEKPVKRFDPKPVAQAKTLYRSCLNAGQRKQDAALEIAQNLLEFGLPILPSLMNQSEPHDFDWIATVARIKRKLNLDILIWFGIEADDKDSNLNRLILHYQYPSNPLENLDSKKDDNETNNSTILARELIRLADTINLELNFTNSESSFLLLSEKYWNFYNELLKISHIPDQDDDLEDDSFLYSVQDLQRITDSYIAPNKSFPIWQHYLDELFAPFQSAKVTSEDKILISHIGLEYLKRLVKVMTQQDQQVIELFVWHRVTSYLTFYAFDEKKSKEICAEHVQDLMGLAVSYTIADENFLTSTKPRVEEMIENVHEQFNQMVLETSWMDSKTKKLSLEKSNAMKSYVGFPEWIMDNEKLEQHFDGIIKALFIKNYIHAIEFTNKNKLMLWRVNNKTNWNVDPLQVNAFHFSKRNAIYILVAFIQHPFYYLGLEALNYGALGQTVGHELTHGFDDDGRFYDKLGNKKPWWSTRTHEEYEIRARCMVEQYNSYSLPEGSIDGTLTLSENIADNGGLRGALRAYRAYVKGHGPEPALPGFDDFSHEQLLFISFAHQDCGTMTPALAKLVLEDEHSPSEFRVKGVVSNMPEFSEAFQCAPGKPMNPEKKCRVW